MLAIEGGKPSVTEPLRKFRTIDDRAVRYVAAAMRSGPLSGYLGGVTKGGLRVEALEHEFAGLIGAKHAIAVNSGTSGLLAACVAMNVTAGTRVHTTPYTMSATAAAPRFLGADIWFGDIEDQTFCLAEKDSAADVTIVTNLFGHPAELKTGRVIEDNAQAIFAKVGRRYAGTLGDIGVFSFNVHKHLQCGEGGICVTDNADLAERMRRFRNHSELFSDTATIGLNLRMTEVTASIALSQLARKNEIISGRIEQAEDLTDMIANIPGIRPPVIREGYTHVFYSWAIMLDHDRDWFVRAMNAEGVPLKAGYLEPLYRLPAFKRDLRLPVVEAVEKNIVLFENCTYDPTDEQRWQIREAFKKVGQVYSGQADEN